MNIGVDESGNYGLGDRRFEAYVLCAVIVPDSRLDDVERFVEDACRTWALDELKCSQMKPQWLEEVATFMVEQQICAAVYVTDNEIMTRKIVSEFRLRQAEAIQRGRERLSERHPDDPQLPGIDALMARVAGVHTSERLSDDDFMQAQQLPELILQAVQRACLRYSEPAWESDFERFRFVFDAKHPDRLKAGERYVNDGLERMLGSTKRFGLNLPLAWANRPAHPFRAFDDDDGEQTLLTELLADREWRPSQEDACLQLADVIAGTVRSVTEGGEASPRMAAYDKLRTVITDEDGYCLHFYRFRGAPLPDLDRYGSLLRAWPRDPRLTAVTPAGAVLL